MFPEKSQFVTVGLLEALNIPPPQSAEFPVKLQFVTVGLLLYQLEIPPPKGDLFPVTRIIHLEIDS
jgi:hypothetical protein